ncbi:MULTISPECIES: hypothetical protein [Burkholderia cepacia complex]|uniref:hypothetical protein n=1 Tax=Burkholderia cepacia complex TaxID=87882 RepID=UPI00080B2453|nr:hypothetical protein [Burkholderia stabilis]
MLEKKRIAFTHSRLRRCKNSTLAEARNGGGVRRQFGYACVPADRAERFDVFCAALQARFWFGEY